METDYAVLVQLAEEVAAARYREGQKEVELSELRVRIPQPKAEDYESFSDDESDGETPVFRSSLKDFLSYDPLDEVLEWLKNYPQVYVRADEDKGVFYLVGKKRTLKQMAKNKLPKH